MVHSRDQIHRLDEVPPCLALAIEDPSARWCQAVKGAAPPAFLFNPSTLQPTTLLQAVEQRIERGDVKLEVAVRAALDQFADVVAVPRSRLKDRQRRDLPVRQWVLFVVFVRIAA
jgi:hypothetical protein